MKDTGNVASTMVPEQVDGVEGNSLAASTESPLRLRPKSDSGFDPSVVYVVCPSPIVRLVFGPTLA